MSCDITKGRADSGCLDSIGGIKNIYIANYNADLKSYLTFGDDDEVTAVSTQTVFYKFELRGSNSIDESNVKDINAGTSIFEASGTISLKKQDRFKRAQVMLLSKGRPQVIVEGYDGLLRLFGLENGVDIAVNTASGSDLNEFNGYTLTLTSKEKSLANYIDSSLFVVDSGTNWNLG